MHKSSTQTNKRLKLGFNIKRAKKPSVQCTRTVQSPNNHSRVSTSALRYNSPDCPVHQWGNRYFVQRSPAKAEDSDEQCATVRDRAEPPVRGAPDNEQCLSVPLKDKASNGQKLPNPNGWVMWLAHRTVSGAPIDSSPPHRLFWWLGL